MFEALDVSGKQEARLDRNCQQLSAKMRELQKRAGEKALGVLAPEQLDKLRDLHKEGYRSLWQQGQPQSQVKVHVGQKPKCEAKPRSLELPS